MEKQRGPAGLSPIAPPVLTPAGLQEAFKSALIALGDQYAQFVGIREKAASAYAEIAKVRAGLQEHEGRLKKAMENALQIAERMLST